VKSGGGNGGVYTHESGEASDPIVGGQPGGPGYSPSASSRAMRLFSFMGSAVSSERPKGLLIAGIAREMKQVRAQGGKILVVGSVRLSFTLGPVVFLERLIRAGYVQTVFTGNARGHS